MSDIVLYGSPVCGMVPRVLEVLNRAQASYQYVDISKDAEARERVREINSGFESVPTLEFPDGSTLTEPTLQELEQKLAALGLEIPTSSWSHWLVPLLVSPVLRIVALGSALVGLVVGEAWLLVLGLTVLVLSLAVGWWHKRTR